MTTSLSGVTVYTAGACHPNPGPGGWAALLLSPGVPPRELCGAQADTTNNRMELRAALEALQALAVPHEVVLHTPAQYVSRGIAEWLPRWGDQGWREVPNHDLWEKLRGEASRHRIECSWDVADAESPWRKRADALARSVIPAPALPLADRDAIHLFTSACCPGTTSGPGGWAAVLCYRQWSKSLSGQEADTSAGRLHLQATCAGLAAVKRPLPIHLYTTSDYLHGGITRWVVVWQARQWQTSQGYPVRHLDQWQALLQAARPYQVQYHLVSRQPPEHMCQAQALAREAVRLVATHLPTRAR